MKKEILAKIEDLLDEIEKDENLDCMVILGETNGEEFECQAKTLVSGKAAIVLLASTIIHFENDLGMGNAFSVMVMEAVNRLRELMDSEE